MSAPYPQGQALVTACSAGQGAIVIVEGETHQEDAYFYGRWFGDRAREVSFFPQDGWQKVIAAVADLRNQLPSRDVFGIIDRDFAPDSVIDHQQQSKPAAGVFLTHQSTVENYLLASEGWLSVLQVLSRGEPPAGWQTVADLRAKIGVAYKDCVDLTAFNYTVRLEYDRVPRDGIEYKKHPKAVVNPGAELKAWGLPRGAPVPLDQEFVRHKQMLDALPDSEWSKWIPGKPVLKVFLEGWPYKGVPHEMLKSMYIDKHTYVPTDLSGLIKRIVERGGEP